ncbi:MAG: hypothetical protein JO312_26485 [Hyphomicrobiales bacterium]|nr:hypothetical protein [Hyphomicrobiales bacterium]
MGQTATGRLKPVEPGRPNDTDQDYLLPVLELGWKGLAIQGPALASVFAFSYVVGYFYAYDITWFPFFTFTEQLVFALKALPIAIVVFVALLIVIGHSRECYEWTHKKKRTSAYVKNVWVLILGAAAVSLVLENYIGPGICLAAVAAGVYYFDLSEKPRLFHIHMMYWGLNFMVFCLFLGFISGYSWRVGRLPGAHSQYVVRKPPSPDSHASNETVPAGHLIFSGANGVLFYDYCRRNVRLVRLDNIEEIDQCSHSDCKVEAPCPKPQKDEVGGAPAGDDLSWFSFLVSEANALITPSVGR